MWHRLGDVVLITLSQFAGHQILHGRCIYPERNTDQQWLGECRGACTGLPVTRHVL